MDLSPSSELEYHVLGSVLSVPGCAVKDTHI